MQWLYRKIFDDGDRWTLVDEADETVAVVIQIPGTLVQVHWAASFPRVQRGRSDHPSLEHALGALRIVYGDLPDLADSKEDEIPERGVPSGESTMPLRDFSNEEPGPILIFAPLDPNTPNLHTVVAEIPAFSEEKPQETTPQEG